jgi:hypothetical protein
MSTAYKDFAVVRRYEIASRVWSAGHKAPLQTIARQRPTSIVAAPDEISSHLHWLCRSFDVLSSIRRC